QPAIAAIDGIDMEIGCVRSQATRLRQDTTGNFRRAGEGDARLAAIPAEPVVRRDTTLARGGHGGLMEFRRHGIGGLSAPVTGDQNLYLLRGQASFARLTAALAGGTRRSAQPRRTQAKGVVPKPCTSNAHRSEFGRASRVT